MTEFELRFYEFYGLNADAEYWFCIQSPAYEELEFRTHNLLTALSLLKDNKEFDKLVVVEMVNEYDSNAILEIAREDLIED